MNLKAIPLHGRNQTQKKGTYAVIVYLYKTLENANQSTVYKADQQISRNVENWDINIREGGITKGMIKFGGIWM